MARLRSNPKPRAGSQSPQHELHQTLIVLGSGRNEWKQAEREREAREESEGRERRRG